MFEEWKKVLLVSFISILISLFIIIISDIEAFLVISVLLLLFSGLIFIIALSVLTLLSIKNIFNKYNNKELKIKENLSIDAKKEIERIECKYNTEELDITINNLNNEYNNLNNSLITFTNNKNYIGTEIKKFESSVFSKFYGVEINHINNLVTYPGCAFYLDDVLNVEISCDSKIISTTNYSSAGNTTGNSYTTGKEKRSLTSMVARGAVGTLFLGPVGGLIGAASAPKKVKYNTSSNSTSNYSSTSTSTDTEIKNYRVLIHTMQIENSVIEIDCKQHEVMAKNIANGILNAINYPKEISESDRELHQYNISTYNNLDEKINNTNSNMRELKERIANLKKEKNKMVQSKNKEIKILNKKIKKGLI